MLQSHFQGAKGEARFSELCADAGLICNKATQDFGGWDYIVDFEVATSHRSHDERETAMTGRVQIKTLKAGRTRFDVRLSAAERLAKDSNPAFICVLKVNERLDITDIFLMHVDADRMASILRRLRLEFKKGTPENKINNKTISFTPNEADRIDCTGESLRKAWLCATGNDLYAYVARKKELLESLGYEGRPISLTFSTPAISNEKLVDAFLGLRDLAVSEMVICKQRFGIPLVESQSETGTLKIQPNKLGDCRILFEHPELHDPVVFDSEVFAPALPGLPNEARKVHVANPFFSIFLQAGAYVVRFNEDVHRAPLVTWQAYSIFRSRISDGQGKIHLRASGDLRLEITLLTPTDQDLASPYHLAVHQLCTDLTTLFKRVGIPISADVSLNDVLFAEESIKHMVSSLQGDALQLSFRTERTTLPETYPPEVRNVIYPIFVPLGERTIAAYGIMEFSIADEDDYTRWKSVKHRHVSARDIVTGTEEEFISAAMNTERSNSIVRYIPEAQSGGELDGSESMLENKGSETFQPNLASQTNPHDED